MPIAAYRHFLRYDGFCRIWGGSVCGGPVPSAGVNSAVGVTAGLQDSLFCWPAAAVKNMPANVQ